MRHRRTCAAVMNRNGITNERVNSEPAVKHEPFTPEETSEIQRKLDMKLGPEYVSARPGGGGIQVSYIEGWKVINLANQVFGYNCWNSEVRSINIDFMDEIRGKYSVGLSATVRVTLKDGSYHEDVGYGSIENARSKAQAFEKSKKEAVTDGLKRALRHYGNALGNCLYDKEYLSKISSMKCAPPDFDETQLMRFVDHNNPHTRSTSIPPAAGPQPTIPAKALPTTRSANNLQENSTTILPEKRPMTMVSNSTKRYQRDTEDFDDSLVFSDDLQSEDFNEEVNDILNKPKNPLQQSENDDTSNISNSTIEAQPTNNNASPTATVIATANSAMAPPQQLTRSDDAMPANVGFFKARVAEDVQKNTATISQSTAFNPQFISPSIRRTVDPTKSTPIKRTAVNESTKTIRYDSPSLNPNRQIGKPKYPPGKRLNDAT